MENAVAESILSSCKAVDEHAKLVHMTKDAEGHTHVRVRAGDVHSVESLRRCYASFASRVTLRMAGGQEGVRDAATRLVEPALYAAPLREVCVAIACQP
jgi:hypothetical protein